MEGCARFVLERSPRPSVTIHKDLRCKRRNIRHWASTEVAPS